MNRPLFCAVAGFALGEVAYLGSTGAIQTGIVLAVPVFCAFFYVICRSLHSPMQPNTKNDSKLNSHLSGIRRLHELYGQPIIMLVMLIFGWQYTSYRDITFTIEKCITDRGISVCKDCDGYAVETLGGNAVEGADVIIEGIVTDKEASDSGYTLVVRVENTKCSDHIHTDRYSVLVYVKDIGYSGVDLGTAVEVSGELSYLPHANNLGGFDLCQYYKAKGIDFVLYRGIVSGAEKVKNDGLSMAFLRIKGKLKQLRERLSQVIGDISDGAAEELYRSLLTGDRGGLSEEIKDTFRIGGISHILAISSLHITLIGGMVSFILSKLGIHIYLSQAVGMVFALFYGCITGLGNSTIRALLMLFLLWLGRVVGRNYDLLTAGALSLILMLLVEPYRLNDGGMQLSFTAIFAIAVSTSLIRSFSRSKSGKQLKRRSKLMYNVIQAMLVQTCLQLVMLPVVVNMYYEVYPFSFLVNLLVVPIMSIILGLGMVAVLFDVVVMGLVMGLTAGLSTGLVAEFTGRVAAAIIRPGCIILELIVKLCRVLKGISFSCITVGHLTELEIVLYYLMLLGLFSLFYSKTSEQIRLFLYKHFSLWFSVKGWRRFAELGAVLWILLFISGMAVVHYGNKKEIIVFMDVGQGDGILIRSKNGTTMMIDGGSSSIDQVWTYNMEPTIKYLGIDHIDYWFVSHDDLDHISGLMDNLEENGVEVSNIVLSDRYVESLDGNVDILDMYADSSYGNNYLSDRNADSSGLMLMINKQEVNVCYLSAGDMVTDGSFTITCVHPDEGFESEDKNALSMALSYESDMVKVLFTGDMDTAALEYMMKDNRHMLSIVDYDIIKLPHHGSRTSLCEDLYGRTDNVVISCGFNN
ncbi:MAG: ComEC/Rec2 family competence protein, partial [Wujia sp.]